jgi:transposase
MTPMSTIFCGIDFHKNTSTICALAEQGGGEVAMDTIATSKLRLYLSNKKGWKIGIEATGGTNHLADILKRDGHDVTLINPNQFRGIAIGGKKTDTRDARALAQAMRVGFVPKVHHKGIESRQIKSLLTAREIHVRHRCALMNHIRGTLREYGIVFPAGTEAFYAQAGTMIQRIEFIPLREALHGQLEDLQRARARELAVENSLRELTREDERIRRLQTIPGVGPMSAYALIAVVDDISRFASASQFASFVGLVPTISASADTRHLGNITRSGPEMLRRYLIHGARAWMRYSADGKDRNRTWAERVKGRRGQNKAVVALAHRLARIAFAVLRDEATYGKPKRPEPQGSAAAAA